jgi:hypothetical protein
MLSEKFATMVILSGVMTRWAIWKVKPNRVELMLQVEQTESTPLSFPIPTAALHTIQPAHLPLISFPGFTTIECVVIDMGSIRTTSEEYISLAALTLMLLPLMTVLETTGSTVHMVYFSRWWQDGGRQGWARTAAGEKRTGGIL